MATDPRSRARETTISFRVSAVEKEALVRRMRQKGYSSLQQLLEDAVFGEAKPRRHGGQQAQHERLDISA